MSGKRWFNNGPKEGLYYQLTSSSGDVLNAATKESANATVHYLNHLEQQVAKLRALAVKQQDTLDRISAEYPSVVTPCKCGKGEGCSKCEITHLLDLWKQEFYSEGEPLTVEEEYDASRGFPPMRLNAISRI